MADNLLARNLHEEMAYLATKKLKTQQEPILKESHFFKTMTRLKYDNVNKLQSATEHITPGQYHPDEWQRKPNQIWIDAVTKPRVIGYTANKSNRKVNTHRYKSKHSVINLY